MLKTEVFPIKAFLTYSSTINEISKPLKKMGITYVTYLKNFKDGSQINLSNSAEWIEHYYQFKLYTSSMFEGKPSEYKSGYIIWPTESQLEVFNHGRNYFDSDNGITVVEQGEEFSEFFFFSGPRKNTWLKNVYINNYEILEKFILFFKNKLQDIIKEADKSRILMPKNYCSQNYEEFEILNLINCEANELKDKFSLDVSNIYPTQDNKFNREIFALLSERETDIVTCLLGGKTAKETAKHLYISHRTVERHLENIKIKLNCRNKFELVNKILSSNTIANA